MKREQRTKGRWQGTKHRERTITLLFALCSLFIVLLCTCGLGGGLEEWRKKAADANGSGNNPGVEDYVTVTFNINNGSGTTPAAQTANSGSTITLPGGSGFSRTDYTFDGWNTNSIGTGANYGAGSSYTVTSNVTLYAKWNPEGTPGNLVEMVWVPGGSFQMGQTGVEVPVTVTLTGFYMGRYEVTQGQWQAVMGTNPSSDYGAGDNYPVYYVSWYDAVEFCNALSESEGLTPYYMINKTTGSDPNNTNSYDSCRWLVTQNTSATGYRLPTEAQWEYAAKGGNGSPGNYIYAGSNNPDEVAWYNRNGGSTLKVVGTKAPNGLGIYDMSGNVWEWCWDWYGSYLSGAQTDPTGASSGSDRVVRGGSGDDSADMVRSAYRGYYNPVSPPGNFGFRLARPGGNGGGSGVDFTNYTTDYAFRVRNNSGERLVAFKGELSESALIGGIPAYATTHGLKKDLFQVSGDFALILITESQYTDNKANLTSLEQNPFTRLFAFYNASGDNDSIYEISDKLGGNCAIAIQNTSPWDVELRLNGADGETLGFARAQSLRTQLYVSPGDYKIFPVFIKYNAQRDAIITVKPLNANGSLYNLAMSIGEDGQYELSVNIAQILQGVTFTTGTAWLIIENQTDTAVQLQRENVVQQTSTGNASINSDSSRIFQINMAIADGKYAASANISAYAVSRLGQAHPIGNHDLEVDKAYKVTVTGSFTGDTVAVSAPVYQYDVNISDVFPAN